MTKKYLFVTLISLFLSSCYHEIDMNNYRTAEEGRTLTLNSIVSADSVVTAKVSRTIFFTDVEATRQKIKNLAMQLHVNGMAEGHLSYDEAKDLYISSYIAKPGDIITLSTHYDNGEVTVTDIVPYKPAIENIQASLKAVGDGNPSYILTYNITFTDPGETENYYYIGWDAEDTFMGLPKGTPDYTLEPVFRILSDQLRSSLPGWTPYRYEGLPFSDIGIEGKRHTLTLSERITGLNLSAFKEIPRIFRLYAISKDYYDFLVSMICIDEASDTGIQGGLIDLGLVEPEKCFSNVNGGVGIMGSCSLSEYKVDIFSLLPK